jgi:hypothetical protein
MTGLGREAPCHADSRPTASDFGLLGDLERVIDLDAKIPHRAFELRVAKEELDGSQVPSSPVDQSWLRASDRVGSVRGRIEADLLHPPIDNSSVLPSAKVRRRVQSAGKQIVVAAQHRRLDPCLDGLPRCWGDLELHWPLGLLLRTIAREATRSPWHRSRTRSFTRSQPRSLLSMPRSNRARSRVRPCN